MTRRSILSLVLPLLLAAGSCWGQTKSQFDKIVLTGSGALAAGATITVCSSSGVLIRSSVTLGDGCSPKVVIYSDPSGTSPKSNPFLADGLGNATFYADPGTDWYTYSITGPTVTSRLYIWVPPTNFPPTIEVFNVQSYGAQGAGPTHDDTAAIQAAVDGAEQVGGIVYFPCTLASATRYWVTSPIAITAPVHLQGCNGNDFGISAYLMNAGDEDILQFQAGSRGSEVDNLGFLASGTATAGSAINIEVGGTIDTAGLAPLVINNVSINETFNGIKVVSGNNFYFSQIVAAANRNVGLLVTGGTGFYVSQSIFLGASRADIELTQGGGFFFTDVNTFAGGYGLLIDPDNGQGVIQLFCKAFIADSIPIGDGIRIENSNGYVRQVEFVDSWVNTGSQQTMPFTGGYGINLLNPRLDGFRWIGGYIRVCFLSGAHIAAGKNIFFRGATFSANGHNNSSGTQPGILVAANEGSFHVEYCIFGATDADDNDVGNQNPGILIPTGASAGWSFVGNILSGGPIGSSLIEDHSTGAKFLDLRGNSGANQEVAAGTLSISSSFPVNLSTFVPTPAVTQKQGSHATFRVINGSTGSVSMASIDLVITHDGCAAGFLANIPNVGSGSQSLSGCTLTLVNNSGSVTSPWGVWLVEVDTIGF